MVRWTGWSIQSQGERGPLSDGFEIRRAAVEKRIPCFTSIDTIKAVLDVLLSEEQTYSVKPLKEYLTARGVSDSKGYLAVI